MQLQAAVDDLPLRLVVHADVWQPPDVNTATYAQFGAAMLDCQIYAALGV